MNGPARGRYISNVERIVIGLSHPGPRPRKPSRPRRPRATFRRTECVWTSEEDDILLADVLHLIPGGIKAEDIRISVEKNPLNGYPHVTVTYDHEIPNTRYADQLRDFEERMVRYERELPEWAQRDAEWQIKRGIHEDDVLRLHEQIAQAFDEHLLDVTRATPAC